jgi:hypothetical protein
VINIPSIPITTIARLTVYDLLFNKYARYNQEITSIKHTNEIVDGRNLVLFLTHFSISIPIEIITASIRNGNG